MSSNTRSRQYDLTVHKTVGANEFRELFDFLTYLSIWYVQVKLVFWYSNEEKKNIVYVLILRINNNYFNSAFYLPCRVFYLFTHAQFVIRKWAITFLNK
jgi:hypothetical protein